MTFATRSDMLRTCRLHVGGRELDEGWDGVQDYSGNNCSIDVGRFDFSLAQECAWIVSDQRDWTRLS
jgi:hypothetical protein